MSSPYAKRTQDEIITDVNSGKLDISELQLVETVTVEKFDLSGEERRLHETRTVTMRGGEVLEHHISKH
jgi:hypothetical protein